MDKPTTAAPRGRPTRANAAKRQRELLDCALQMFLERGFAYTTIRDVAAATGMTRRTVYARYTDKRELFRATLENGAERMVVSEADLDAVDISDLRNALREFVQLRVDKMLTPLGVQMQRFIFAESPNFPEMVRAVYARISEPTNDRIAALLAAAHARGEICVVDPQWAARSLMSIAVGAMLTNAVMTGLASVENLAGHVNRSIDLFLNGVHGAK